MPCTFCHPLAVVPFRRLCPHWTNFAALVIGSMSPDFGYYVRQFPLARFAHTIVGTVAVCLPSGLVVLGLFYLLRKPLCFMLPQPHRNALMPLAVRPAAISVSAVIVMALCVLVGAWTHTIWDSFTHEGSWTTERISFLRVPIIHIGGSTIPVANVLQQISTFGGAVVLAVLYFRWLRGRCGLESGGGDDVPDLWRYTVVVIAAAIGFGVALPCALRATSGLQGYAALRAFVFQTAVYAVAVFVPLLIACAVAFYAIYGRRSDH